LTICATLRGCYLVNIKTRAETLLDGFDSFELDLSNEEGYSIRCDTGSTGRLNSIEFYFDGLTQAEYSSPYYMFGDKAAGSIIKKVDYISTCGRKELTIVGSLSSRTCFEKTFKINASNPSGVRCDDTPVEAPVAAPVRAPILAPVAPPSRGSCRSEIVGFILVDANLGSDIEPLGNFVVSELPALLNIRADVATCTPKLVDSVLLDLDGITRCERFTPYTSFGDSSTSDLSNDDATYNGRAITVGSHVIKATPYAGDKCTGTAGSTRTKAFTVKSSKPPVRTPVRAPVNPPVRAPVRAPVKPPVRAPVRAPVKPPVRDPVQQPVEQPVAPDVPPVSPPVNAPSGGSCRAEIVDFTLVDANLGSDIKPLGDFVVSELPALLNIRADVAMCTPKLVESVLLDLDGITRCERFTPYTSFGDSSTSDLSNDDATYNGRAITVGSHVIKATPYAGDKCTGTAGSTLTKAFTVQSFKSPVRTPVRAPVKPPVRAPVREPVKLPVAPDAPPVSSPVNAPSEGSCRAVIVGFTLVDANLGSDIKPLGNFVVSELPALLNIRADVAMCTPKLVESVLLDLDGITRCEQFTPYTSFGDSSTSDLSNDDATYNGRAITVGSHVIKATPYGGDKCTGTAGSTRTKAFTVKESMAPVAAPVPPYDDYYPY
jgi:hypothetical protein